MDGEILRRVSIEIPCREPQLSQLLLLLDPSSPISSTIVIHGTTSTAKSLSLRTLLPRLAVPYTILESRECITGRHLLERIVASIRQSCSSASSTPIAATTRVESLAALTAQLNVLLSKVPRFILVLDGIDKQREAPATLLPALARLGELIPSLTVVMTVTSPRARYFHRTGIPFVEFPAYERDEVIEILSLRLADVYFDDPSEALVPDHGQPEAEVRIADSKFLWPRFVGAVWDSLGRGAARDIVTLRTLAERLWPAFVAPIRRGEYRAQGDFARLMVRNRTLFQGEVGLYDGLLAKSVLMESDFDSWRTGSNNGTSSSVTGAKRAYKGAHELPYHGKLLLIAAFIASHNPARTDAILFMKMHEKKRRKIAGVGYRGPGRPPKHRRGITRKLLGPQPFSMERWLAICHALAPDEDSESSFTAKPTGKAKSSSSGRKQSENLVAGSADLLTQVATLTALRLVVRTGAASDVLDPAAKYRANVGMEYAAGLARAVKFEMNDYLTEG